MSYNYEEMEKKDVERLLFKQVSEMNKLKAEFHRDRADLWEYVSCLQLELEKVKRRGF